MGSGVSATEQGVVEGGLRATEGSGQEGHMRSPYKVGH